MKSKLVVALCLTIGLIVVVGQVVLAYNSKGKSNFAGVTTAYAEKWAIYVNPSNWNAQVKSSTGNPTYNIARIGWTWWTFRETCVGVIIDNWPQPGRAAYNANSIADTGVDDIDACSDTDHWGWSMGVHDFAQGSSVWQPSLTDTKRLP